jgi:UDP-N-acetylmuramate dehydrogenase
LIADNKLQGNLLLNEPMARYNSWRVGGKADRIYLPAGLKDLQVFLEGLDENEPVQFVGLGSNLLVRDGGVRGTVIVMHNALNTLEMQSDLLYADAGVTSAKVAKFSAKNGKQGAEFLAGIPGTVGGALAMNAGCHGGETWDIVNKVKTIDIRGKLHTRKRAEFLASYRHIEMPQKDEWFVGAWFELLDGNASEAELTIKSLLAKRLATQPLNLPNAGSTFRNPEGDYAARLIEACGLKGRKTGEAQISEKHANFIVTYPGATAEDVEQTIKLMRDAVKEKFGIELQQEVRVIGEKLR